MPQFKETDVLEDVCSLYYANRMMSNQSISFNIKDSDVDVIEEICQDNGFEGTLYSSQSWTPTISGKRAITATSYFLVKNNVFVNYFVVCRPKAYDSADAFINIYGFNAIVNKRTVDSRKRINLYPLLEVYTLKR